MTKKKKRIIFYIIGVVLFVGIILTIVLVNTKNKKDENVNELVDDSKEKTVETLEYKESLTITLEDELPSIMDYVVKGTILDEELIYKNEDDEEVIIDDTIVGTYRVFINDKEISKLIIIDNEHPKLKLKTVTITENDKYSIEDFVTSCNDNSKEECILSFKEEEMASLTKVGAYDIIIVAKDSSDNEVEEQTTLTIDKKKETTNTNTSSNVNSNVSNNNQLVVDSTPTPQIVEEISYKYGTKITKITSTDGSVSYKYDYSTFNGTTADMKAEASSLLSTNANNYNEVLKYTNAYRSEVGVSPLVLDSSLNLAATIRAIEMAYADKFDHTRPNNTSCFSVIDELGITGLYTYGENIASGNGYSYYSPQQVTVGWRNSSGHYKNMINNSFTKLGVGYYKLGNKEYYVQMFGG